MFAHSTRKHILIAAMMFMVMIAASANGQEKKEKSLYQRVGGYDAIAAVVDDFVPRLLGDPQVSRFFVGVSTDSKMRIRQLVVDMLCQATGGPCVYIGRSMKTAHEGMGITDSDWDAAVQHLTATLDKFNVPMKEKGELLALTSSLKPDIVAAQKKTDTK